MATQTVTKALADAADRGLARIDAQMLLLYALGRSPHDRAWLIAHDAGALPQPAAERFAHLCARRLLGEPVAYLLGSKAFYGLDLAVDARVLDPRPDTETLVDWALELLHPLTAPRVLDLGTGSGAIALALGAHCPGADITAIDASEDALAVARANAERLQLPLHLQRGKWFHGMTGAFDLIVSNPPYVREDDPHLHALRHEPRMALASGADGLDAIRAIVQGAPAHLVDGGWLLLEHGYDQASAVRDLLMAAGFAQVQGRDDLAGLARCSGGSMPARSPA